MEVDIVVYEINGTNTLSFIKKASCIKSEVVFYKEQNEWIVEFNFTPFEISVICKDEYIAQVIQAKSMHAILVHKRFDIVEYLSRWLSLKELRDIQVMTSWEGSDREYCTEHLEGLIALLALRDEPNKPKHLREPEPPKVSVAQKPRVHKVYKG